MERVRPCFGFPQGTTLFFVFGGTGAGSPQWAAIAALANQAHCSSLGGLNSALYTLGKNAGEYAENFHDITVGNNKAITTPVGFSAVAGYDAATGWCTPNVANLGADLAAAT